MLLYFRLLLCSLSYVHEYFALWSTQLILIGTMQNNLWSELQDGDINRIQLIPRKLYAGVQMSVEQTTVHCVSKKMTQLWNGIARIYVDQFRWQLAEVLRRL